MGNNNDQKPSSPELLEEYQMCQEKASNVTDSIWRTASIFTVGSIAGILVLAGDNIVSDDLRPSLLPVASFFAIGILFTWLRLARRWWSIEHAMFLRMRHIERQLKLNANLYVKYLDHIRQHSGKSDCEEGSAIELFLPDEFREDFVKELKCLGRSRAYEYRGVQPMMHFAIIINIAAWIAFLFIGIAPCVQTAMSTISTGGLATTIRFAVVVIHGAFVLGYGLWQWQKKE